jgi:AraC family transcriptional regulator of adaptative response/methylated-DNA-[protein]-cysteine methyltransferase
MPPTFFPLDAASRPADDYALIARVIGYLRTQAEARPRLAEIAAAAGLGEFQLQRLFTRWAGISPKRFLQALALDRAQTRLRASADVLSASLDAGLSGPGRLHDLFVTLEAMTPGEFKQQGAGLRLTCGFHPTPFGEAFIATTSRGVCALEFTTGIARAAVRKDFRAAWPRAEITESNPATAGVMRRIFGAGGARGAPPRVLVRGTNFQVQVWRALLRVPPGGVTSYGEVARAIGRPRAVRAVGTAVGANPVAYLIPCHRVLRSDGALGGYRWGETRKAACLPWEDARRPLAMVFCFESMIRR